LRDIT